MFEGIVRGHFSLYLLVNVVLAAGSPGIYSSDLGRSHRHASCSSCSRDSPAALANWNEAPYARGVEAEAARWPSSERPFEPSQPSLLSSPYSLNSPNPYGRAPGSGGAPAINRSAWGTRRRENPFAFESRNLDTDLASAPAAAVYGLNAPVTPYQSPGLGNLGRSFNKADFYDQIKRQSIPPVNNQHLRHDSTGLGLTLFEDPKTKLSVVYRADRDDDGSNEDARLYPSDYPARQLDDRRLGVRRQIGVDRLGQAQRIQTREPRVASGPNYENQSRDFRMTQRFGQEDESRNSRTMDRFAQTRDQSRASSGIYGFINPEDQHSDIRLAKGFMEPREEEYKGPGIEYGFMNPQENQSDDFKKVQRFAQQKEQFRESRMTDTFSQPRDQPRDHSVINGFLNPQDQASNFRMDQRFVQPQEDQFRDPRTTERFSQHQEDRPRDSSTIQLPEVMFDVRDLASKFNVMKMIHQMGATVGNRSSLEDRKQEGNSREVEKQGGQRESQVIQKINGGDQGNKDVDPREKQLQEEVKEKRGAADRKITADDQLDWSGAELVQVQTTTELPAFDLTNIETMA